MAVQHRPDFYSLLIWVCVFIVRHENKLPFIHDTKNKGFNCQFFFPLQLIFSSCPPFTLYALPLYHSLLTRAPSVRCVKAVRFDLPVSLPPSSLPDSTTHTHTHTETRLSLSPALTQARCLISSSVVWKCVCVCVCLYKDKLAQGLLRKCQDCHWERCEMALNRHSLAVTNTEQATCRSVVWEYIVSLP